MDNQRTINTELRKIRSFFYVFFYKTERLSAILYEMPVMVQIQAEKVKKLNSHLFRMAVRIGIK